MQKLNYSSFSYMLMSLGFIHPTISKSQLPTTLPSVPSFQNLGLYPPFYVYPFSMRPSGCNVSFHSDIRATFQKLCEDSCHH